MGSTVGTRYAAGTYTVQTASGASNIDIQTLDFVPKKIEVANQTNNLMVEWCDGQASGTNTKHAAAGDRSTVTSAVRPLTSAEAAGNPGFRIPSGLADINDTAGEILVWQAWG